MIQYSSMYCHGVVMVWNRMPYPSYRASFIDIDIQDSTNDIEKPVVILTKDTNWYMLN